MTTRQVWFHDRYGHEITSNLTLEHFAELYDSIAGTGPDEDWRDVSIGDSDEWSVTVTPDRIIFENVEAGSEEARSSPVTRDLALAIADAFLRGDFATIRARLTVTRAPQSMTERRVDDLFTTFVAVSPETMIRAVEEVLLLPWATGEESPVERTVEGMLVTSSDDADLHDLQFIQSVDLAGEFGEDYVAVLGRAAPVVADLTEAITRAWGEPSVVGQAETLHACTLLEVALHSLGVDEVLAWRRDERYILFFQGVYRASGEYAAAFWIASREVVEDVAYDIAPDSGGEDDDGGMDVDDAWAIIERVLGEVCPDVAATLRGPVSDADLDRLARTVGRELPADLVQSLRRHDGQDNPTQLLDLFDHYTLLSAAAMIEQSDLLADALGDDVDEVIDWMTPEKVRATANCRGWLQFTAAEGQGYALDLDPLPAGEVGQVIHLPIDGPTPTPEYGSYRAWLSNYAEKLASGAFTIGDDGDLWLH